MRHKTTGNSGYKQWLGCLVTRTFFLHEKTISLTEINHLAGTATACSRGTLYPDHQTNQLLHFNKTYFAFTVLLFLTETLIALFLHDQLIRPYFGGVLVVILIYCFFKSFFTISVGTAVAIIIFD